MAATSTQSYIGKISYHDPFGSYNSPPYMKSSMMSLPKPVTSTSQEVVLAAACSKVQALYKEIIAKEKEYEQWKWSYTNSSTNRKEYEITDGIEHRSNRLQLEGDFLALALKVKKLHQEKARGAEYLRERICKIMADIGVAIREDLTFVEKCLDHERKQQASSEQSALEANFISGRLRDEYFSLSTRVDQFASMEKTFEKSHFILGSGKECSLPVSNSSINLIYKLRDIERKLPDSEFVRGLKSFMKGVQDFFSCCSPQRSQTIYIPTSSEHRREQDRLLQNQTLNGWSRLTEQARRDDQRRFDNWMRTGNRTLY